MDPERSARPRTDMAADSLVGPIPDGARRGWRIWLRDTGDDRPREIRPVSLFAIHDAIGLSVAYGLGHPPERFDRFVIHERGGGGVIVVPYALIESQPYVGVIRQFRALCGRAEPGLPMGGVHPGETRLDAACRELQEETGLSFPPSALDPLAGRPFNPSPGFFRTDRGAEEGATFYTLLLTESQLCPLRASRRAIRRVYALEPGQIDGGSRLHDEHEAIGSRGLRFYHAELLMRCAADGFTLVGIGRLLARIAFDEPRPR